MWLSSHAWNVVCYSKQCTPFRRKYAVHHCEWMFWRICVSSAGVVPQCCTSGQLWVTVNAPCWRCNPADINIRFWCCQQEGQCQSTTTLVVLLSARVPAAIFATMLDWELGYCQSQGGRDCFFLFEMHLTFSLFHAVFGLLLPVLHLVANPCTSVCFTDVLS